MAHLHLHVRARKCHLCLTSTPPCYFELHARIHGLEDFFDGPFSLLVPGALGLQSEIALPHPVSAPLKHATHLRADQCKHLVDDEGDHFHIWEPSLDAFSLSCSYFGYRWLML